MGDMAMVTVSDYVMTRDHSRARWVVVASFVGLDGGDPRCVDYRVRVVPDTPDRWSSFLAAWKVIRALEGQTVPGNDAEALGSIPPEGIPRWVFEQASQARLLQGARRRVQTDAVRIKEARPDGPIYFPEPREVPPEVFALLVPPVRKPGRPPQRSMAEKLRILARVEDAFAGEEPLAVVAREVAMSRSALRDLLSWARNDAQPRLFTHPGGVGKRGGGLTQDARAMLSEIDKAED